MSDFEQHELGFPGTRRTGLKLRRGIHLLPAFMTVGNMLCGFYAVMATVKGGSTDYDNAAKALGVAIVFDSFDGFVARATGTSSEFGKQFDSLADMVSFGIAPAVLGFAWGVRGIAETSFLDIRKLHEIGWWVALTFVICCAWRSGSIQHSRNGSRHRIQIFRWPAVPGSCGTYCRYRARDQDSDTGLALVDCLDARGDRRCGLNVQYSSLPQL